MEYTNYKLRISPKNGETLNIQHLLNVLQIDLGGLIDKITGRKEDGNSTVATITAKAGEEAINEILNVLSIQGYNVTKL